MAAEAAGDPQAPAGAMLADVPGGRQTARDVLAWRHPQRRVQGGDVSHHVYKTIELTGSSPVSIEDAVTGAIAKAGKTMRNMQWFEVTETRGHIVDGKVAHWQVSLKIGFTLED